MVTFGTDRNIFEVIDTATPGARAIDAIWLAADAVINTSNANRGTTVVVDFAYDAASVVEYTVDGGTTWIEFNEGVAVQGGQSLYIRVLTGASVNFRAKTAANLTYCFLGTV